MFLDTPPFMRVMCLLDMVVLGSFYPVLFYGFMRHREWVRAPSLILAGLSLYQSTFFYFPYEFLFEYERANMWFVVIVNIPYTVLPLVLAWRVWPRGKLPLWPQAASE